MLEDCTALAVADDRDWLGRIFNISKQAGFVDCRRYTSPGDLAAFRKGTPPFLLLHHELPPELIRKIIADVRGNTELESRFIPIIMITGNRNHASILKYLQMGFDDIVIFPCDPSQVAKRLASQIVQPQHYFQTQDYFGPDRRKSLAGGIAAKQDRRAGTGGFFRHFVIQRHLRHGIKILSTQTNLQTDQMAISA